MDEKTEQTEIKESAKAKPGKHVCAVGLLNWILIAILSIGCSCATTLIYDRYLAQKVVAYDFQGFLAKETAAVQKGEITIEQMNTHLEQLKERIDAVPPNQAVITADVVLRNINVIETVK